VIHNDTRSTKRQIHSSIVGQLWDNRIDDGCSVCVGVLLNCLDFSKYSFSMHRNPRL
jgi:hypothetical protein